MATHKPTIVFAPGAWHKPSSFDLVKKDLEGQEYPVVGVTWPSVGAEPATKDANDDAAVLRDTLVQLADKGTEVVVVSHSYGGLVASNALSGLGFKERKDAGQRGGVIMNLFVSSFVVPKNLTLVDLLPGNEYLPWMKRDGDKVIADTPNDIFYHDLTTVGQKKAVADLTWQSAPVYATKATYEPWHTIPSAYLICDQDRAVVPIAQEAMAKILGSDVLLQHVDASHSPFLSKPDEVAKFVKQAADYGLTKISLLKNP